MSKRRPAHGDDAITDDETLADVYRTETADQLLAHVQERRVLQDISLDKRFRHAVRQQLDGRNPRQVIAGGGFYLLDPVIPAYLCRLPRVTHALMRLDPVAIRQFASDRAAQLCLAHEARVRPLAEGPDGVTVTSAFETVLAAEDTGDVLWGGCGRAPALIDTLAKEMPHATAEMHDAWLLQVWHALAAAASVDDDATQPLRLRRVRDVRLADVTHTNIGGRTWLFGGPQAHEHYSVPATAHANRQVRIRLRVPDEADDRLGDDDMTLDDFAAHVLQSRVEDAQARFRRLEQLPLLIGTDGSYPAATVTLGGPF